MSIRRVVPDITCNQIHESRKFYTGFLGFDVAMDMDWVVTLVSPSNPTAQITLVQEIDGEERRATLRPGEYAINPPGVWHTADVNAPATAVFITAGVGTQGRPRSRPSSAR